MNQLGSASSLQGLITASNLRDAFAICGDEVPGVCGKNPAVCGLVTIWYAPRKVPTGPGIAITECQLPTGGCLLAAG